MTEQEARLLARIVCGADGGCHVCAKELITDIERAFPEHASVLWEEYEKEWPPE